MSTTSIINHHYQSLEDYLRTLPPTLAESETDAVIDEVSRIVGAAMTARLTGARYRQAICEIGFDMGLALRKGRVVLGNGRRMQDAIKSFLQTSVKLSGFDVGSSASTTSTLVAMTTRIFKGAPQRSGRSVLRHHLKDVLYQYGTEITNATDLARLLIIAAERCLRESVLTNPSVRKLLVKRAQSLGLVSRLPGREESDFCEILCSWQARIYRMVGFNAATLDASAQSGTRMVFR